jgi:hypothetical protein
MRHELRPNPWFDADPLGRAVRSRTPISAMTLSTMTTKTSRRAAGVM